MVHCWHGSDRTGAVIAAYRMVFQDVPRETAIEEMRGSGYGFHESLSNLVRLLERLDVEKVRENFR